MLSLGEFEVPPRFDQDPAASSGGSNEANAEIMAIPQAAAIRTIMLNHWYHHRGPLSVYLRTLDIPLPSICGPNADENPFG